MPQRFTATENAFEKGIENTSAKQGAKLVGEWVEEIRKADFPSGVDVTVTGTTNKGLSASASLRVDPPTQ